MATPRNRLPQVENERIQQEATRRAKILAQSGAFTGPPGADGADGAPGATGATGATGPAGPAPAGTGFVHVTSGVLDTPIVLNAGTGINLAPSSGSLTISATGSTLGPAGTYSDFIDRSLYPGAFASYSDDFNGSSLGALWTAINTDATSVVSVANGKLAIRRAASNVTDKVVGVVTATPAGAWAYEMMITLLTSGEAGYHSAGPWARRAGGTPPNAANVTTDKAATIGIGGGETSTGWGGLSCNGTSIGTSGGFLLSASTTYGFFPSGFIRMEFDGADTLTWSGSLTGCPGEFVVIKTCSATTQLGGAPDSICLGINNEAAFEMVGFFHYFWRVA